MVIPTEELIRTLVSEKANMVAYISFLVGGSEISEDIFQNISIAAYQKRASIKDRKHLMAWLRIAARHESLNAIRSKARSCVRFDSILIEQLDPHWKQFDNQQFKAQDRLKKCMDRLSMKAKTLVKLKYFENLQGDVIAETLNMKLNAVYVGLSRIHRSLAECVQKQYTQES